MCVRERDVVFLYGNYKTFSSGRTGRGGERTSTTRDFLPFLIHLFQSRREHFVSATEKVDSPQNVPVSTFKKHRPRGLFLFPSRDVVSMNKTSGISQRRLTCACSKR